MANRKVVAAQGFFGSAVGEPSCGLSKSISGVVVSSVRLVDSTGYSPAALRYTNNEALKVPVDRYRHLLCSFISLANFNMVNENL